MVGLMILEVFPNINDCRFLGAVARILSLCWAVMYYAQIYAVQPPGIPTLEIKVGEGWIQSIDVVAEVPLLQQRVGHRAGRAVLCHHLHAAARGGLGRQWGVLGDAGLTPQFVWSLPRRKHCLMVWCLRH